jgi:hypothetical protein
MYRPSETLERQVFTDIFYAADYGHTQVPALKRDRQLLQTHRVIFLLMPLLTIFSFFFLSYSENRPQMSHDLY